MRPGFGFLLIGAVGVFGLAAIAWASADEDTGGPEDAEDTLEVTPMSGTVRAVLGEFFSWDEVERTSTGLPNSIPAEAKLRFQVLHDTILDPLRRHLGKPVRISSGYRSEAVNLKVGGEATSRHRTGEAADIKVEGMSPEAVAATIRKLGLKVDQVIDEATWTHIGISLNRPMRGRFQRRVVVNGRVSYPDYVPNPALAV